MIFGAVCAMLDNLTFGDGDDDGDFEDDDHDDVEYDDNVDFEDDDADCCRALNPSHGIWVPWVAMLDNLTA